jgi:hypothetical protein
MFFISISFITTCFGSYGPSSSGIYTSHYLGAINTTTDPLFWRLSSLSMYVVRTLVCYFSTVSLNLTLWSWSKSVSEQYRPSDSRLSEKLVPTFADIGCHVVSVTDSYDRIIILQLSVKLKLRLAEIASY